MDSIKSPCINICSLDPGTSICEGCQRSLDEIRYWSLMTDNEKRRTLQRVEDRRNGKEVESDPKSYELTRQKRQR